MKKFLFILLVLLLFLNKIQSQEVHLHTIAFYNLENLFDPEDNPKTIDDDYTPTGRLGWNEELLNQKIDHLASVISEIGKKETHKAPLLLGVAEVENIKVLKKLITNKSLSKQDYGIIHFDSPDARGIDVALLYQKRFFIPSSVKKYPLLLYDGKTNRRRYTRDQLVVSGWLEEEEIHVLVNHWPSRRGGQRRSESSRMAAGKLQLKIIDSLQRLEADAKIICMGDFNDNPNNHSLKLLSKQSSYYEKKTSKPLFNPMESMQKKGLGSLAYRDRWFLFDQILISKNWLTKEGAFFLNTKIYNPDYLKNPKGKYKGYPFRNQITGNSLKGYSDHFPVYMVIAKVVN